MLNDPHQMAKIIIYPQGTSAHKVVKQKNELQNATITERGVSIKSLCDSI